MRIGAVVLTVSCQALLLRLVPTSDLAVQVQQKNARVSFRLLECEAVFCVVLPCSYGYVMS